MHTGLSTFLINSVRQDGKKYHGSLLTVRYLESEEYRYSPVISKKYGNAAKRNRVKRLIREAMRNNRRTFPSGMYIIYVNRPCEEFSYHIAEEELRDVIGRMTEINGRIAHAHMEKTS